MDKSGAFVLAQFASGASAVNDRWNWWIEVRAVGGVTGLFRLGREPVRADAGDGPGHSVRVAVVVVTAAAGTGGAGRAARITATHGAARPEENA